MALLLQRIASMYILQCLLQTKISGIFFHKRLDWVFVLKHSTEPLKHSAKFLKHLTKPLKHQEKIKSLPECLKDQSCVCIITWYVLAESATVQYSVKNIFLTELAIINRLPKQLSKDFGSSIRNIPAEHQIDIL